MTNCEKFWTKYFVKIAALLTSDATYIFLKCVTRMLHQQKPQEGNLDMFYFPLLKMFCKFVTSCYYYLKSTCCINKWIHSFIYIFGTHVWNRISIGVLVVCKNSPEWQKVVIGANTQSWTKFESDSKNQFLNRFIFVTDRQLIFKNINLRTFYTTFWNPE